MFRRILSFLGVGKRPTRKPLSSYGFTPVDHPLRSVLDERYGAMREAMAARDAGAIAAILTDDFASLDVDGKRITADTMIESVRRLDIDRSKRTATTTLAAIAASPGRAIVLQNYSMTSTDDARATPKALQTMSVDTWDDVGGTWLLARTETRQLEVTNAAGIAVSKSRSIAEKPVAVTARMWEYIEPVARGKRYEDPLHAFLAWSDLGRLEGGGSQLSASPMIEYVEVHMRLADSAGALDAVAALLEQAGAPRGSELHFARDGRAETREFGTKECVAVFLDGISLPKRVYAESKVDDTLANLRQMLVDSGLGRFRSYWHGNEETGMFFFGDDAGAMYAAMRPILDVDALCQNARVVIRYGNHPAGSNELRVR
jgi:ketosteroid isomerase-like protein